MWRQLRAALTGLITTMIARPTLAAVVCCVFLVPFYLVLATAGVSFDLWKPSPFSSVFNSMLEHLLRGEFDVDPDLVQYEGFAINGKVYAYFGIWPALLRVLALPFVNLREVDLGTLSCISAALIAAGAQLAITLKIAQTFQTDNRNRLTLAFIAVALVAGPQVTLLKPSIYQESIGWGTALSYCFIYFLADIAILRRPIRAGVLVVMACLAGACLLDRVSTAIGLYGAMAALICWRAVVEKRLMSSTIWAPALFLGFFAAVAGLVNYERFGNPLVFNDFKYYIRFLGDAKFIENYDGNGVFNFHRIWYGAIYYFFPVWIAHGEAGRLIFAQFRDRFVSGIELPVSSFLISDPLLLAFGWRGAERLFGRSASLVMPRWTRAGLLAALAIPGMLMLIMIFYAYRYRAEFYPAFLFAALVGFYDVGSSPKLSALKRFAAPLALWTVAASIALWFFYQLSHFGGAEGQLEHGLIDLIKSELQHAFRYFSGD